jgi:hypothetical protein
MNARMLLMRLALSALALVGLGHPCPAQAQELPKGRVPFKATVRTDFKLLDVTGTGFASNWATGTGEAAPLGQITLVFSGEAHWDFDPGAGVDQFLFGRGVGSFTAANGDAIYVRTANFGSSYPGGIAVVPGSWLVTGGSGRFAGARGSGTLRLEIVIPADAPPDKATLIWEGTITAPKQ